MWPQSSIFFFCQFLFKLPKNCSRDHHVFGGKKRKEKKFGLSDNKLDLMAVLLHCQMTQLMWRIFCVCFCDFMTRGALEYGLNGHHTV